jgi:pimeloyl-ACP methyl ester carboxylesterase
LVHGFASSFDLNWRRTGWVDLLTDAGREVIALDLLGHGSADKPRDPSAYEGMESGIGAVLPPDGQVDAVGFSLGAGLLLRYAARHPERFGRIVVAGIGQRTLEEHDSEPVAAAIEAGLPGQLAEDADDPASLQTRAFSNFAQNDSNDPLALAACMRRRSSPLTVEELAAVTVPVLVVLGDKDFVGKADAIVEALPDASFQALRGVDHFGTPQSFGFIDAAMRFLDV